MLRRSVTLLAAAAFAALSGLAGAQAPGAFTPPTEAMDTLNSGSATGGLDSNATLGRVNDSLNNQGPGGPAASPFGDTAGGFQPPAQPGGFQPPADGSNPFGGGPAGFTMGGINPARLTTGIGGQRIVSKISGQVISDARAVKLISTDGYYDDGKTGGDAVANDGIFTNIETDSTRISPEEFVIKSKIINGLGSLETYSPQDFFQVRVATSDPISSLPKLTTLEAERDERLKAWSDRFLRDFRENPDDTTSKLLGVYFPPPPRTPSVPLPQNFSPRFRRNTGPEGGAQGSGGGSMDDRMTRATRSTFSMSETPGDMPAGASSRYF